MKFQGGGTSESDLGGLVAASGMSPEEIVRFGYSFIKLMSYYNCAIMEAETKFNVLNEEFSLMWDREPISAVKSRLKDPIGIKAKLEKKGLDFSVANVEEYVNDVAGVRVICSFLDDVYMIAEALKKQDDVTVITEKDYIKSPKPNGYRSLHLIVSIPIFLQNEKRNMKVEIQIRTISMDCWASLEHQLRYKKDGVFDSQTNAELVYCAAISAELDQKMNALRLKTATDAESDIDVLKRLLPFGAETHSEK